MVDFEHSHGFLFVNANVVLPFFTDDSNSGQPRYWAFTLGGGYTLRITPWTHWQLDFFGLGAAGNWSPWRGEATTAFALGAGVGAHVTLDNGLTFALKAPLLGAGPPPTTSEGALAGFYGLCLVGLPLFSFGYRF